MGPWSGLHFEVDPKPINLPLPYQVAERITATNLNMRNHRPDNGIENQGNGGAIRFSNQAKYCTVSNFWYEQEAANTQLQYIIRIGSNANHITIENGMIFVEHATQSSAIACYGIYLDGWDDPHTDSTQSVTITGVTIHGPTIGLRVSGGCKNILIANNTVRNTYHLALMLTGECQVTGNQLLDVAEPGNGSFINAQGANAIICENNVLRYSLATANAPAYYFEISQGATRFYGNRNHCYGLPGNTFNYFGQAPASFLENKFVDNEHGFSGGFTWSPAATQAVDNTNVTPYTQVLLVPTNAAAGLLLRSHGVHLAGIDNYHSFTVSTSDGSAATGGETFGYHLA